MSMIDEGADNTIHISIDEANYETAQEILSDSYTGFVSFNRTGNSVVVDVRSEPAEQAEQEIEDEHFDDDYDDDAPENFERAEVREYVQADPAAVGVEAAAERNNNDPLIPAGRAVVGHDAMQEERRVDDRQEAVPSPRNTMIPPSVIMEQRIPSDNSIYGTIAQIVGGESVNLAKQLEDSLRSFNTHYTKAIALKRKVDEATQQFTENSPAIISIVEQANNLADNYDLVEEVYFTNSEVVFITTPLITDDRWDGHKRLIGKMRIAIKLEALFSPNPTAKEKTISIKNLTHRYVTSQGNVWECGHVRESGSTCFGTAFEAVFQAIVARDLTYIIEALLRFIKSPNPNDSWGSHLKYWPIADENGDQTPAQPEIREAAENNQ